MRDSIKHSCVQASMKNNEQKTTKPEFQNCTLTKMLIANFLISTGVAVLGADYTVKIKTHNGFPVHIFIPCCK